MRAGLYGALEASLAGLLGRHDVFPRAILMVTAHWEEAGFGAGSAAMQAAIARELPDQPHGDALAASAVAEMVGALALARALGEGEDALAILAAARAAIKQRVLPLQG